MSIGNNIKELRLHYALSQQDLAKIADVSPKTVSAWETGRIIPRMGPIQKIADHFGLQKSDIIEPPNPISQIITNKDREDKLSLSEDEKKLVYKYRSLANNYQQMVSNVVSAFLTQQQVQDAFSIVQNNNHGNNIYAGGGGNSYTFG